MIKDLTTLKAKKQILLFILIITFIGEVVVMIILDRFTTFESSIVKNLIDSTLLSLIIVPFLYFILVKKYHLLNEKSLKKLAFQRFALDMTALVSTTDMKGKILSVNDKFCETSGYTRGELVGSTHRLINSGFHSKEFWQNYWLSLLEEQIWKGEVCNRKKDGKLFWIESSIFPIQNTNNEIIGFSSVSVDISERKIKQQEAEQAFIREKKAIQAKSEFLSNMSHEIRTPMNGILSMITLLNQSDLSEEQQDFASTIQSSGKNMMHILNDILDYSKLEAEKVKFEKNAFNIKDIIDETIKLLASEIKNDILKINSQINVGVNMSLYGSEMHIRQILVNLISNAIKFTPRGEVTIIVDLKLLSKSLMNLTVIIKDTGIGISAANQKKLFKPFSQADESITKHYGGTGLGLAISAMLAEKMDGKISVQSQIHKGSTFTLSLPVSAFVTSVKASKQDVFTEELENISDKYPQKILVAEDDLVNQKVITLFMQKLGYDIDLVSNGLEVLSKLTEPNANYDIIFMDIQMPKLDGIATTKQIISKYKESCPSIVALTAGAFNDDKEKCLRAGMTDFIVKPIKVSELKRILVNY